jgi:hypothetical protein
MRPLGEPPSITNPASTNSSPLSSMEERRRSNGAASTPYGSGSSGSDSSKSSTGLVLARRNVSTLTAVQTAAAGASTALMSRDQLTDIVVADVRVSLPSSAVSLPGWQSPTAVIAAG